MSKEERKVPELRFKGFHDDWEQRKLNTIVKRVTRKNKNNESTLPLTISAQDGLVDQNTYFNKQVASKDMSNYYLLMKGDFAYNKSYSNGFPLGTVKRLDKYDQGALSSLYIVFRPKKVNTDFLSIYYDTNKWHREVMKLSAEGARNHGLLNIPVNSFFEKNIIIPIHEKEQLEIAKFLKRLEKIIALHQRKINTLKEQKKAYFRRVLVGKSENKPILRFKNFYGKWSNDKLENLFEYGGSGGTPKSTVKEYYEGNIPFLSISDISNSDGYINRTEKSISQKGLDNSAAWIVPKGAMSLAMYASVGKLAILNIEVATSQAFYNMVFKDDNLRDFVYQSLLKTNELNGWDSLVSTGTQRNLNANKVKNFTLSVPSNIHELIKVSKLLMNIDKVIDFHQSKLDNLIKLKTVYLNKMFI